MAASVTRLDPTTLRARVIGHIEVLRAPVVAERDAMAAELHALIAADGPGQAALRAKIKASNQSGRLVELDTLRAALHREGDKPIAGMKTLVEQVADKFGIE